MKIILYLLIGMICGIFIISLLNIKIILKFNKKESEDSIRINLIAFKNIFKYEHIIPYKDIIYNFEDESIIKMIDKLFFIQKHGNNKKVNKDTNISNRILKYFNLFYRPIKKLIKKIIIKQFIWNTHFGYNDAAIVGLLTGVLWTFKGQLLTFLRNSFIFTDESNINITPHYNNALFETHLICIIQIKIGYIIITLVEIVYLLLLKGGELNDKSTY